MPPKAGRGRRKAAKQETLEQFVKPNHDELTSENNKEVSNNKLIGIDAAELEENNTNSIDAAKSKSENFNELEFSQMNGSKESLIVNGSIEEFSNNDEASLANDESTTISEEKVSEEILPNKCEKKQENVPSDDNEVKSDIPIKRGRKNKTEISKTSNENKETVDDPPEENSKEVKSEVPMKRGRRNKTENSKITNDAPEENSDEVKSEVPMKRARRNKTENSEITNENKETVDEAPEENVEQNKRTRAGKNKKQSNAIRLEETSKVGQKKKNSSHNDSEEKVYKTDLSDMVAGNKFLQVHIIRDKELDERSLKETEIAKSAKGGGSKRATKRKSTGNEDTNEQESGKKPAKVPKNSKSKGQSKKDKMPDVTQLNFENTSKSPNGKPWNLKISSWNVNGVRAWIEKDGLAYLQHESPDILCVQETKCSDNKLPKELDVEGYKHYCLAGDKDGYSGVALFTKEEPLSIKYGIEVKAHDNEGRVITAEYEKFFLVCAYVPNAGRGLVRLNYRMEWDKDFLSYLMSLDEKKPVILCGDLNVAHEEIDLANPKSNKKNAGFTKEEREGFSTLLSEGNFIDTFRHLYPDQKGAYTFWTYMMNARAKNVGWRLDYFIMSKRFIDHLCDQVIRKDVYGSDHCPITLFLAL